MCLACNTQDKYPLTCSLWFFVEGSSLWCAAHEDSKLVKTLLADGKCGFEVTGTQIPYSGVRGHGDVVLHREPAEAVLERLMLRYLEGGNTALASWLRSRVEGEYALEIKPHWMTAWDFSHRMNT